MKVQGVIAYLILVTSVVFISMGTALAIDAPHPADCANCHTFHGSPGPSLTAAATNENLCLSCHASGKPASGKPFASSMQAVPGVSGTSHRWDASMPPSSSPNNTYGLRATADLTNSPMKQRLGNFDDKVVCSVCHDVHSQAYAPWDPFSSATPGASGRHFQRDNNDLNQLCEDCHYYRTPASGQTSVRTYTGNKLSHPVVKIFSSSQGETPDVSDTTQFNTAPREPAAASWSAQTGARYHLNGTGDTNLTNNIVLDANKRTRCLSCHGIHYADSDSSTTDGP